MQAPSTHINKDYILSKLPIRVKVKKERENIEVKRVHANIWKSDASSITVSIKEPHCAYYRFVDKEIVSSFWTMQEKRKYTQVKPYLEITYGKCLKN